MYKKNFIYQLYCTTAVEAINKYVIDISHDATVLFHLFYIFIPWICTGLQNPYGYSHVCLTFSRLMTHIYIYIYPTAPLTSRCYILYIYSTYISTEYFKHAAYSPFFLFKMPFIL